jgi:hypothetical protein
MVMWKKMESFLRICLALEKILGARWCMTSSAVLL